MKKKVKEGAKAGIKEGEKERVKPEKEERYIHHTFPPGTHTHT
jgi:hypothetical protein